jgi:hypothetical protein
MSIFAETHLAQVAELVDAPGSGPGGGNTVEVRVLSWAPDVRKRHLRVAFSIYAGMSLSGFKPWRIDR